MVNNISGLSSYQYQSRVESTNSLTDDQKKTLQDIISKYDPETITQDQMKSMMDEIKEAGIKPGKAFGEVMNAAGFKPPEKPQGAPPQGPPPQGPPPDVQQSSDEDITTQLLNLLNQNKTGEVSENDINDFIQSLKNSGNSIIGTLVNQKV